MMAAAMAAVTAAAKVVAMAAVTAAAKVVAMAEAKVGVMAVAKVVETEAELPSRSQRR
jgi:hypothetical protein